MNYVPYSTTDSYYKIKENTHDSQNPIENFTNQTGLQQFREKERLYHQKSNYQTDETMQIESYKNILTIVFYVLCVPLIYFIYISDRNIYLKGFYVALALTYPMYISFVENIVYGIWIYIIALIRGVPTEKL